ncbi:MAG: hypothetical protein A3D87_07720 [Omnitrophica WOR_2 bacterium RIFCSPHIGHO2_02_FULL_50_17]|nr:MAG: hypothetical protein A3D87_07720 [Omnitrophica WOR_2 bacterium RIFCSPHIGHO2_02_FULL_50_17]
MKVFLFKVLYVFCIFLCSHACLPPVSMATGPLKDKLQQKIKAESNIQYQQFGQEGQSFSGPAPQEDLRQGMKSLASPSSSTVLPAAEPVNPSAIASYAIYQANYTAALEENVVTVKGKVIFEVFKKGWNQIPIVKSDVGLIDVTVNKGASFVTMQGGRYYVMVDKPGRYQITMEFLIKASRERENGPGSFSLDVVPAPISQFEFTMPETEVEIFVEPAIRVELEKFQDKTVAWAIMPNTNLITTRWTKAIPKEEIAPVALEPKVYADTSTYASIGEGILRCQTRLNFSILQSEVSNFRIALPEDISLLDVQGRDLRDWKITKSDGQQDLDVYLNFGLKGNYVLELTYERNIGEGSVVAEIPWIKVRGAERENGHIGVSAMTNVELAAHKLERVTSIDVKELPSSISENSRSPILLAFKYFNHPYRIHIDVTRHEELPVLVAAIDSVNYLTLHTVEGKILTQAIYQVRNNVKQFLRINLPVDAMLWSTFVAGKPVKPAKDKNGHVLIPLEKSQLQGQNLTGFPVEVVYLDKGSQLNFIGELKLRLPKTDIPISSFFWSLYVPEDYYYFKFDGDVKKEAGIRPSGGILGVGGSAQRAVRGRLKGAADDIGQQMAVETQYEPYYLKTDVEPKRKVEEVSQKGILPLRISVPQQGYRLSFSKLIVTENEGPWVSFRYVKILKHFGSLIRIAVFVIIFFVLVGLIKKVTVRKNR